MNSESLRPLLEGSYQNCIFPFLWLRGEPEEVLREEIDRIDACGIKAICLESRPHPDFCGEGWWKDFDIVLEEAKARGMKIWILDDAHFPTGYANGRIPEKYPERARQYAMVQHTDVTGPIPYAELDVGLMTTKRFTWMDFGKPREDVLRQDTELLSVIAARVRQGDQMEEEYVDLTGQVRDRKLIWDIPEGVWRIFVCFTTYAFGARNNYINYIDKDSVSTLIEAIYEVHYQHYPEEFGKTIAGFFSDEPGFYNTDGFSMDEAIGRKVMALPWNHQVPQMLKERIGADWKQKLPMLWYDSVDTDAAARARYAYMDTVSTLYSENFSKQLGDWCRAHHVEYIGHVIEDNNEHSRLGSGAAHYFRAMAGQDMAGIDNIGGQILPGNPAVTRHGVAHPIDGEFCHYGLGKMGASAAAIDPKKQGRLMCETYGAYGWNLGVKGMKWITDYLLLQGVNRLVPHAFSMKEYPDDECPPHFYARGKNPQFPWFAELMKYANRMCTLFDGGKNVPAAAILYHGELEWLNDCMLMQKPARELLEHQIDFEFLPVDALVQTEVYGTTLSADGLCVNERQMKILIVPETDTVPYAFAKVLAGHPELPVIFVNHTPSYVTGGSPEETKAQSEQLAALLQAYPAVPLHELSAYLKQRGICDVRTQEEQKHLGVYHYLKSGEDLYFLFNTDLSKTVDTRIRVPQDRYAMRYDALKNTVTPVVQEKTPDDIDIDLKLNPYESVILVFTDEAKPAVQPVADAGAASKEDISRNWKLSLAPCGEAAYTKAGLQETLAPVSLSNPLFSGRMKYEKTAVIHKDGSRIYVRAEYVYECAELFVNGISAGKRLTPDYVWEITDLSLEGENALCVVVVNTPTRDSLKYPSIFGPEREVTEPSGMFGKIQVMYIPDARVPG